MPTCFSVDSYKTRLPCWLCSLKLLNIFSQLKGLSKEASKAECEKMKKVLKIEDKAKSLSKDLSGGMKRKLSVGIALSADTKVSPDFTVVLCLLHTRYTLN